MKGHSARVLDFDLSPNGKHLVSCANDRTVLVWSTKHFGQSGAGGGNVVRGNIAYDEADRVKWSPDSKAFLVHKVAADEIEAYRFFRKPPEVGGAQATAAVSAQHGVAPAEGHPAFKVAHGPAAELLTMGMSSAGKFIMTSSKATDVVLYGLKGDVLAKLDTCLMLNHCVKVSPDGTFLAAAGFAPDVKVWQLRFSGGSFEKAVRAFELTGHKSSVYSFDFTPDSSRMATVSRDGFYRVFDTKVEFERGQDPVLVASGPCGRLPDPEQEGCPPPKVAISPDGRVVAVAASRDVRIFSASAPAEMVGELSSIHAAPVTNLTFDAESKWLITSGDKHLRVFHNVPGHKLALQELRANLGVAKTEGAKERLSDQIKHLEDLLRGIAVEVASS